MRSHLNFLSIIFLLAMSLTSCNTMKKAVSWVPMPKMPHIPMPSFSSIKRVIPGMDRNDKVDSSDPMLPFQPEGVLSPGHTLRIKVFAGMREAEEEFEGLVMIDNAGVADFDEYGKVRLGGLNVYDARKSVETLFRSGGFTASALSVHIVSIENVKLVFVEGDVVQKRTLAYDKHYSVRSYVLACGGRPVKSQAHTVYITQKGLRRFYRSEAVADEEADLQPGAIIYLNPEL